MRCLVSGAAGFMGSHLVDYLSTEGHTVTTIDNLSTGFKSNLKSQPRVQHFKVDLLDKKQTTKVVASVKPEVVYHLAAWAHEGLSPFCPIQITENNLNATLNILVPSIRHGMHKFVFTSSMSVYGEGLPPFDEKHQKSPIDIYGIAKDACERAIDVLSKVHGYEYTILRPHNVYGPRQSLSDPYRNVVGIFIRRAIEGESLIIYGDGEQTRAFTYIDDITPAIALAGLKRKVDGEIINIGPLKQYSINELASIIQMLFDDNVDIEHIPDRTLEVKHAYCTNKKAKRLLKYKTNTSFKDGLINTVAWAKVLVSSTGIAKPRYLKKLELPNRKTPQTWLQKSL